MSQARTNLGLRGSLRRTQACPLRSSTHARAARVDHQTGATYARQSQQRPFGGVKCCCACMVQRAKEKYCQVLSWLARSVCRPSCVHPVEHDSLLTLKQPSTSHQTAAMCCRAVISKRTSRAGQDHNFSLAIFGKPTAPAPPRAATTATGPGRLINGAHPARHHWPGQHAHDIPSPCRSKRTLEALFDF